MEYIATQETMEYILHLNELVALLKPSCDMEVAHSHHDWIEINIRRVGGATYYAGAKVEYVRNLENTLTPLELINTLLKMGKQGGTYY